MKRLQDVDAYLSGELDEAAADVFEEAMFDAPDNPNVAFFDRLIRHGTRLAKVGTFDVGVTRAHIDQLIAAGHSVQLVDAGLPNGTNAPLRTISFSNDAELIATALPIGRKDIARVDVEILILEHNVSKTITDILVDQSEGVVYGLCERPLAHLGFAAGATHTKVRPTGSREVIAEWHIMGRIG